MRINVPQDWLPWLDTAQAALDKPDVTWSMPGRLDAIELLKEIQSWACDDQPFNAHTKRAWNRISADLINIRSTLAPALVAPLSRNLYDLEALVENVETVKEAQFRTLQETADRLADEALSALADNSVLAELWSDLIESCRDPAVPVFDLELHRDEFIRVLKFQEYDLGSFGIRRILGGILADEAESLHQADPDRYSFFAPQPMGYPYFAGLSINERINACKDAWYSLERHGDQVVWLACERAPFSGTRLDLGNLTLYSVDWISVDITQGEIVLDNLPHEIAESADVIFWGSLQNLSDHTLLRVRLDNHPTGSAVTDARETVDAILHLISAHQRDSWRLMTGHLHFVNGHLVVQGPFMPDRVEETMGPILDVAEALEESKEHLSACVPISRNDQLRRSLHIHRTLQNAKRENLATQVSSYAQALEHANRDLAATNLHWEEFAKRYLREIWVKRSAVQRLYLMLRMLGSEVAERAAMESESERARRSLERLRAYLHDPSHDYLQSILSELSGCFVSPSTPSRYLLAIQQLNNLSDTNELLLRLESDFDRLINRLVRFRNSMTHGGPVEMEGVSSVAEFGSELAFASMTSGIEGILEGRSDLARRYDERRKRAAQMLSLARDSGVLHLLPNYNG